MTSAAAAIPVPASADLTNADRKILDLVEPSLARGIELYRWWREADRKGAYRDSFALQRKFNQAARGSGFFDQAQLSFGTIPVLGVVGDHVRRFPAHARGRPRPDPLSGPSR